MRPLKQRTRSDCGIVAVAVATGNTYAAVRRVCGSCKGGLWTRELEWLLGCFCAYRRVHCRTNGGRLRLRDLLARRYYQNGRFVVSCGCLFSAHAIAVVNGQPCGDGHGEWFVERVCRITGDAK